MKFTTAEGERVYFDSNGESPARYELVNIQMTNKGTMEGATVGIYDASLPESHQFIMNKIPVVWGNRLTEVKRRLENLCCCFRNRIWTFDMVLCCVTLLNCAELCCWRCLCRCAVAVVPQELIRSSRKESQSAAMAAHPVLLAKSVI